MLYRFPPADISPADQTFVAVNGVPVAKLKVESRSVKRKVFLTSHTVLFVIKGKKLLHFEDKMIEVGPESIILLRKGVYVMAEYMEKHQDFEALLLFLPDRLLKEVAAEQPARIVSESPACYFILPGNDLTIAFKGQLRQYFDYPSFGTAQLLSLKQREIILLLLASGYRSQVANFLYSAANTSDSEMEYIVAQHILQDLTLTELAALCNRSLATFKRDFGRIYDTSPKAYINARRLEHARMLLINTAMTVTEVADTCGYENASYFSRLYLRQFGFSPRSTRAESVGI